MATRKRTPAAPAIAAMPEIPRSDDRLKPVSQARPVGIRSPPPCRRYIGRMLQAGTITLGMFDAARAFAAEFTLGHFDSIRCTPLIRSPAGGAAADLIDAQPVPSSRDSAS